MPVTKRTRDFLSIRSVFLNSIGALVRFDRPHHRVAMTWLAGIIPIRRMVLPLDEVAGAQVRKTERNNGRVSYGIVLRRKRAAEDLSFACASREDAMDVLREIVGFLEPDADGTSAAPPDPQ